ncbi:hypothetical protein [Leptospira licerasiae]|uniref:GAF domain-containing protein n=1 Tax=Leptospira licerasiae str. MMD4847 TaxID=1049971 RepID=A0ABN0HC99_9LEPT|nr:hypothetical protein [Leptospira licerasiae]EIE02052.1 hypothetical protein LEP1GSC185_1090 [Leptospira licerasiae serovar Varillal str. VAR 010]EJZ43248.1 hypothetical protein LEP1GSC178_3454 [Leptospira licerasiae str. MMD4847]TGM90754.1 hypothetical protein EHR05_08200 [Leptospira licerasiae]
MKTYFSDLRLISSAITVAVRLLSVFVVLGLYELSIYVLPKEIEFVSEIAVLLCLVFGVFAILPIQEKISGFLKSTFVSEYLSDDPGSSRLAHRRFDSEGLIKNVFPELVRLTNSNFGKLAILKNDLVHYELYTYAHKKQRKVNTLEGINPRAALLTYILNKRSGAMIGEPDQNKIINEDFVSLRANFILPFVFREKLFGFLAVSNIPKDNVRHELGFLAGKCALAVHNQILSSQIAENKKYRKELENAGKIRKFLESPEPPMVGDVKIDLLSREPGELLEFFQSPSGDFYFVFLRLSVTNAVSVLALCYILGTLYSSRINGELKNILQIKSLVEDNLKEISWTERYDLAVGMVEKETGKISLRFVGKNFKLFDASKPDRNLASIGWENIETPGKDALFLTWNDRNIISFHHLGIQP